MWKDLFNICGGESSPCGLVHPESLGCLCSFSLAFLCPLKAAVTLFTLGRASPRGGIAGAAGIKDNWDVTPEL